MGNADGYYYFFFFAPLSEKMKKAPDFLYFLKTDERIYQFLPFTVWVFTWLEAELVRMTS